MINTAWESRAWQADMQLVGKLAFSVSALFVLALAYRFYKSRTPERASISREDATVLTGEEARTSEVPRRSYEEDETTGLRLRRSYNNLQDSKVSDLDNTHLSDKPLNTQRLLLTAQKGLQRVEWETGENKTRTATCENQTDAKSAVVRERGSLPDPEQCQNQDSLQEQTRKVDSCDGKSTESPGQNYRQDPEGIEMNVNLDSGNEIGGSARAIQNIETLCDINVTTSQDHQIIHEQHRFSSTAQVQIEENIIQETSVEDTSPAHNQTPGCLRGKVYNYHVESTSQTLRERNVNAGASPSDQSLAHLKADLEPYDEKESVINHPDQTDNIEADNLGLFHSQGQPKDSSNNEDDIPSLETRSESGEYKGSVIPSSNQAVSRDIQFDSSAATFHVSLNPESTFDIHLELGNCYEVLSLAKKHNLDDIKVAAYKVMSINYLQVLQNPSVYGRLNATERDLILDIRMKGRRYVVVADIDTPGYSDSQNHSSLKYYDNIKNVWHVLSDIPKEAVCRGCSVATMFNYIFVALGSESPERQMKPSKRVVCYNPLTNNWREICPLKEARPHCKLVALDGYLYAIGGECLHTVERYDPRQNRWSYVAPLPNDTFAVAHMAAAYDDEIYVTGGTIRYMLLRYRPKENVWKNSIISGSKDRTTDMVAANNFLYRFDLNRSMGISVHRCNIRARIWYECANYPMPYPTPFQCAVIDNNIFCISRNFHLRFLTDDISPRFVDGDLTTLPQPKGVLYPLVLHLPVTTSY
ncbi:kelch domain-containing 7A [Pelobates cultripes]|uniref:Kelch domain-containing 7A n=1 Tax=Pelobates cultripes TaxID=61616 RepID=A0AAD1T3A6_PELCU|nr:kelch domain-containing 7A [Pelobates cultripes]